MQAVDLGKRADAGARVVAFIDVGMLLLALGELAPVPPAPQLAQPKAS